MKKRLLRILVFVIVFVGVRFWMGEIDLFKPQYQEVTVDDSFFDGKVYFEQLKEDEQLAYKEIYQGLIDHVEEITVHSLDGDRTGIILQEVMYDFPGIFWCDGSSESTTYEESHVVIEPHYEYSTEEQATMQREIDEQVDVILASAPKDGSDYEKIKYVYETLVGMVDYVKDAPDNQNIYSTFVRKETVCAGYAKATMYLLEKLDVYCIYVVGDADGESHGWNVVKCEGEYCVVDVTWGDPAYSQEETATKETILYDYLCCSDASISTTHTKNASYVYPECVSDKWEYYRMNGMFYASADSQTLLDAMYASIRTKSESVTFKFGDSATYQQGKEKLENELIEQAATYLCKYYKLRQVECTYNMYDDMNRFVIYWQYQ